jgi:hypothetical protein
MLFLSKNVACCTLPWLPLICYNLYCSCHHYFVSRLIFESWALNFHPIAVYLGFHKRYCVSPKNAADFQKFYSILWADHTQVFITITIIHALLWIYHTYREFKTKYYSSYNDKIKIIFSIKKACTALAIEQKPAAVYQCVFNGFIDRPLSHHIPTQFFLIKYLGEYLPPF